MEDAEIRKQCAQHGIKCGPLTATTRKIFLKRLEKAKLSPPQTLKAESSDSESDDELPSQEIPLPPQFKMPLSSNIRSEESIHPEMEPEKLSDTEIIQVMRRLGIRHGPINHMTRKVYHKKIKEATTKSNGVTPTPPLLEISTDDERISGAYHQERVEPKVARRSPRKRFVPLPVEPARAEPAGDFSSSDEDNGTHDVGTSSLEESVLDTTIDSQCLIRTPLRERNTPSTGQTNPNHKPQRLTSPLASEIEVQPSNIPYKSIIRPRTIERSSPVKRANDDETLPRIKKSHPNRQTSILTQATPPPPKRAKKNSRDVASDLPAGVWIANSLPLFVLLGFFFLAGIYCYKAGINFMPTISYEVDDPLDPLDPFDPLDVSITKKVRTAVVDIYSQVEYDTMTAVCDFKNILTGPPDTSKLTTLESFNLDDEVQMEVINLVNGNEKIRKALQIDEEGYVAVDQDIMDLGFTCQVTKVLSKNYVTVRTSILFGIVCLILSSIWTKISEVKRKSEIEVQQIVREIIDSLQNHAARKGASGMRMEHVRDQIIPMGDEVIGKLWKKAEASIKQDSRLRLEQKFVDGEEAEYWIWEEPTIKACNAQTSRQQPLAECLKIRNMLIPKDYSPNEHAEIKRTLTNWCKGTNGVCDIDLNPEEGTVYVKCSSLMKAGEVYGRIRANWYKKNLVQVKYIKLEVYHRRFKNSVLKNEIIA